MSRICMVGYQWWDTSHDGHEWTVSGFRGRSAHVGDNGARTAYRCAVDRRSVGPTQVDRAGDQSRLLPTMVLWPRGAWSAAPPVVVDPGHSCRRRSGCRGYGALLP